MNTYVGIIINENPGIQLKENSNDFIKNGFK